MPYLHLLSKTSITMFCASLVSRVWLFVGEDILRDKMNGTMRFGNCCLTDVPALLPCAMLPRQARGTHKNSSQNLLYCSFCLLVQTWKQFCGPKCHICQSESLLNCLNCSWPDNHNQSVRLLKGGQVNWSWVTFCPAWFSREKLSCYFCGAWSSAPILPTLSEAWRLQTFNELCLTYLSKPID